MPLLEAALRMARDYDGMKASTRLAVPGNVREPLRLLHEEAVRCSAMNDKRLVKTSKYLSRHLRHDPGRLGLTLEPGGWVSIDALLRACRSRSFALSVDDLRQVVERNDKRRFSFDETRTRIRANQGHSVEVDLKLEPASPPAVLFHGTGLRHLDSIMRVGLKRAGRHHVHLSTDTATATRVGARHGRAVVLEVAAARMREDGFTFYVTANGVWLTWAVPTAYLSLCSQARQANAR